MSDRNGHHRHDPTTAVPEPTRDWLGEAGLMVAKKTLSLPEVGHVEALLNELVPLQKIVALQNRALICLLLQINQSGFVVPAKVIAQIEAKQLDLLVHRNYEGAPIVVKLLRPAPAPTTD